MTVRDSGKEMPKAIDSDSMTDLLKERNLRSGFEMVRNWDLLTD
jgi:hypothetical protein